MITWHTMFAYGATATTLSNKQLGVQKDQALQIFNALTVEGEEETAPLQVQLMWQGYEYALAIYGMFMCMEWTMKRGFVDDVFWELGRAIKEIGGSYAPPPWLRDKDVVRSHRSNLMRRWPDHYHWPATPENLPYIWPINQFDAKTGEPLGYDLMVASEDRDLLESGERVLPRKMRERIVNL